MQLHERPFPCCHSRRPPQECSLLSHSSVRQLTAHSQPSSRCTIVSYPIPPHETSDERHNTWTSGELKHDMLVVGALLGAGLGTGSVTEPLKYSVVDLIRTQHLAHHPADMNRNLASSWLFCGASAFVSPPFNPTPRSGVIRIVRSPPAGFAVLPSTRQTEVSSHALLQPLSLLSVICCCWCCLEMLV